MPVPKYFKKYPIMVNDVDFNKNLKLSAAFNYFQEIANLHSDNMGISFNTIEQKFGVAWVLTRIRADISRYPVWNEEVTLETWPQIPRKYEFERDFIIRDSKGEIIGRAVSVWIILDVKTRALQKTDIISVDYPEIITERAIDCSLGKIKPAGLMELAYKRKVGCSDIDMNGHLNNSRYIDFIMDCFSMDELQKYHASSIQVSYVSEALPGETITLNKCISEAGTKKVYIEGKNEATDSVIFRAQLDVVPN